VISCSQRREVVKDFRQSRFETFRDLNIKKKLQFL
jgi:hypothetical protein